MGVKSRLKRDRPKIGEIIEVIGLGGAGQPLICRVDAVERDYWSLSIGEVCHFATPHSFRVIRRRLPEPPTWLGFEIAAIRAQLEECDCPMCRTMLADKEAAFSEWISVHGALSGMEAGGSSGAVAGEAG